MQMHVILMANLTSLDNEDMFTFVGILGPAAQLINGVVGAEGSSTALALVAQPAVVDIYYILQK